MLPLYRFNKHSHMIKYFESIFDSMGWRIEPSGWFRLFPLMYAHPFTALRLQTLINIGGTYLHYKYAVTDLLKVSL